MKAHHSENTKSPRTLDGTLVRQEKIRAWYQTSELFVEREPDSAEVEGVDLVTLAC